jgi:hypothetical protein
MIHRNAMHRLASHRNATKCLSAALVAPIVAARIVIPVRV